MNQSHQKAPFAILLLLIFIGAGGAVLALWLIDHRQAMPGSGIIVTASLGVFVAAYTGALVLYRRWRNTRQDLEGTICEMIPGSQYRVIKPFTDYYGNVFEYRQILRFKERHFLPYDGGHTIVFDERSLYLQEEKNREILENFSKYIVQI